MPNRIAMTIFLPQTQEAATEMLTSPCEKSKTRRQEKNTTPKNKVEKQELRPLFQLPNTVGSHAHTRTQPQTQARAHKLAKS